MSGWRIALAAFALMAAHGAYPQEGGDLQAQILYAFHTEDLNQARELARNLEIEIRDHGGGQAMRYQWAHAEYRYAELIAANQPAEAARALETCVHELAESIAADAIAVEPAILQSACYSALAPLKSLGGIFLRTRAQDRIERALKLAPRNPRALLVRGMQKMREEPDSHSIVPQIREAAEIFEHTPATSDDSPGWGHAEAYLLLGHLLRIRGDVLAARNWIERALLAAPDYRAAQRELALLTH